MSSLPQPRNTMQKYFPAIAVTTLLAAATAASALPPAPAHVRGSIASLKGQDLTVTTASGPVHVHLTQPVNVATVIRSSRTAIKPGSFVGITSIILPNGSQRATEIHVFPESMRGSGEGSRDWDWPGSGGKRSRMTNGTVSAGNAPRPKSRMTNGTVSGASGASSLTLQFKSPTGTGSQGIIIPPGIPVVTFDKGSAADLKPGVRVFVIGAKGPGNTVSAARIVAGKNGVAPPM